MGRNKNKEKGTRWERDACKELNKQFPETWKRTALSGAIGIQLNIPILASDMVGDYEALPKRIYGEAKVGYGGSSMKVQKEWFDGIAHVAEGAMGIPAVLLKFEKSRTGVRHVIAFSFEAWNEIMVHMDELQELVDKLTLESMKEE